MKHATKSVALGDVAQTLMIPLWSRAIESQRRHGLLRDPKAQQIVAAVDFDFERRFAMHRDLAFRACLRTVMIDRWVRELLAAHPRTTVVEIGTGLNTRFERVDNGQLRWFDLDLPDTIALRRGFFTDGPRRTMVEGAFGDEAWLDLLPPATDAPMLFIAEAVLVYLEETTVRRGLAALAHRFPGSRFVFDTVSRRAFAATRMMRSFNAPFRWACDEPRELERWGCLRIVDFRTMLDIPADLRRRVPLRHRLAYPWLRLAARDRLTAHALVQAELASPAPSA